MDAEKDRLCGAACLRIALGWASRAVSGLYDWELHGGGMGGETHKRRLGSYPVDRRVLDFFSTEICIYIFHSAPRYRKGEAR
jgi:hypothetical protein